ncbi:DUF3107 domain-containing protein [Zafaria sp. Z1313]|uniref:DUF3107 domain-containing protein n=1 Tax=unclassified Zafaria TaxID=2828765 RepID=UPI002E78CC95|nr:DUF3107 domain-containing protein [Zafaria sp. J156]MEE1620373.1 DUF3107 domain-containing protein [Zafaria sp. J156]
MDVRIGIQNVAREVVIESSESADRVAEIVTKALHSGQELQLTDAKGRTVIIPTATIGFVEIGAEEPRRVGFAH